MENYARAKEFYEEKVGFEVEELPDSEGVGMLHAGRGTQVLLYERERTKAEHTALAFVVEDIDTVVSDLRGRGVVFEEYDLPGIKTEHGIARIGASATAWFLDPEGNIISINQMQMAA